VKIYTKTGDAGETGLLGGPRVRKDHARVAAYGAVDEVNAAIGLCLALEPRGGDRPLLETIQRDLFAIGAELATPDPAHVEQVLGARRIGPPQVGALEAAIDAHEDTLPPLKNFILPGGAPPAAALHLARTVCRRAERAIVELMRRDSVAPAVVQYVNRLSDLLFVLARAANARTNMPEIEW